MVDVVPVHRHLSVQQFGVTERPQGAVAQPGPAQNKHTYRGTALNQVLLTALLIIAYTDSGLTQQDGDGGKE